MKLGMFRRWYEDGGGHSRTQHCERRRGETTPVWIWARVIFLSKEERRVNDVLGGFIFLSGIKQIPISTTYSL